jgi:predicted nucleic acid-binding protein
MKVVLDTNVLVAAARSRRGASFALISSIPAPEFQPCLSVGLYAEWQEVLTRPENLPPGRTADDALRFLRYLAAQSHLSEIHFLWRPFLPDADDDDIGGFATTHSLSPDETGKPIRFPSAIWQHVADHERPHVKERWSKFDEARLTEVLTELTKADIEPSRPNQRPYWTAHVYANADAFFHADEDNPPPHQRLRVPHHHRWIQEGGCTPQQSMGPS